MFGVVGAVKTFDHKQVFGAGFHAGVKSVLGGGESVSLSASRMKIIEGQQTGIAKKVLECVPKNEAWDARRIVGELARLGSAPDLHIVQGCLSSLKESGLVVEGVRGMFQRAKPRPDAPLKQVVKEAPSEAQASKSSDPIDALAAATSCLRDLGGKLATIADQIDDAVLAIDAQTSEQSEEIQKLRQLREIIKGLGS